MLTEKCVNPQVAE